MASSAHPDIPSEERDNAVTAPSVSELNCNLIPFAHLCGLLNKCERIEGPGATERKLDLVFSEDLVQRLRGDSVFPLLRLLLPAVDTERGRYGLKAISAAKLYVQALNLSQDSVDAQRLLHWEDPRKSLVRVADFGSVLEDVLHSRVSNEFSTITIGEVNGLLDAIAKASGKEKEQVIRNRMVMRFSPNEQKWVMRIIFQDLKVGLKKDNILRRLSPTAIERFNECTSLRTVCEEVLYSNRIPSGIRLFNIYSPMLALGDPKAKTGQIRFAESSMRGHPFVMDIKLDGERMSCHIQHSDIHKVAFYTRNGNDYTSKYQKLADDLMLAVSDYNCIIDGEVLAYSAETNDAIAFGANRSVGIAERDNPNFDTLNSWMTFVAFDLLYLEGIGAVDLINSVIVDYNSNFLMTFQPSADEVLTANPVASDGSLLNLPLQIRRQLLERILGTQENRIEIVKHEIVLNTALNERLEKIENFYHLNSMAGEEGLVVKVLNASNIISYGKDVRISHLPTSWA